MVEDTYRRPRRTYSPDESDAEKFNRYSLRKGPGKSRFSESYKPKKPLNEGYGHENKVIETIYPKGWKPNPSDRRSRVRRTERSWTGANLVKKLGVVSVALIAGSALFMTPNITGNVIWGLALGKTNMLGAVFFIWGLAGLLFSLRQK